MDQRTRRSPARFLAPLALIAVVVALATVISGAHNAGSGTTGGSGTTQASTVGSQANTSTSKTKTAAAKAKRGGGSRSYTIKVGDTLGGIADREGVPLQKLQELNPDVDSHAMVAGQKIRLR